MLASHASKGKYSWDCKCPAGAVSQSGARWRRSRSKHRDARTQRSTLPSLLRIPTQATLTLLPADLPSEQLPTPGHPSCQHHFLKPSDIYPLTCQVHVCDRRHQHPLVCAPTTVLLPPWMGPVFSAITATQQPVACHCSLPLQPQVCKDKQSQLCTWCWCQFLKVSSEIAHLPEGNSS